MIHGDVELVQVVARIAAMALGASAVSATAAFVYRWYSGQRAPEGVPILLGLSVVALWLNTTDILQSTLANGGAVAEDTAAATVATFAVATIAADAGRRFGDHVGAGLPSVSSVRATDADVGQLVRAAGRVLAVRVPETIEDIDGYEPVTDDVKAEIAGSRFLFPRRLTVDELHERFAARLKHDYDVGHVDVEFEADGTIAYLALGRRLAGVGHTLAPGSVAVAIRADPAFSATPGDRVQVWRDDGDAPERVVTAELRAAVGDVATIVLDESDADALADDVHYRLVTMPSEVRSDREFASLLRTADETITTVDVASGSDLEGVALSDVGLTVVAVRRDGDVETVPPRDRRFAAGDQIYAIGRLDAIRRLESRAGAAPGASEPPTARSEASTAED